MPNLDADFDRFQAANAQVLGISVDYSASSKAWADSLGITQVPLLSDYWPHGSVSRDYGVFLEDKGFATRGTFVIDKAGRIRWSVVNGPGEARDPDDYTRALREIA